MRFITPCAVLTAASIVCSAAALSAATVDRPLPADGSQSASNLPMCVVPAGVVSDRTRVEIRVRLEHNDAAPASHEVEFYLDTPVPARLLGRQAVTVPAGSRELSRCWWDTHGRAGRHTIIGRVESQGRTRQASWPVEVIPSDTPGLPVFQGVWLESFGVLMACQGDKDEETKANVRASIDAMNRLGMDTIVLAYVEYQGTFFYPSELEFFDGEVRRTSSGRECRFDMVETILSQADKHGMHVLLGLGRSGDPWLLWEFDKPDWTDRNRKAIDVATRIAADLWSRYGHHASLYGWYLTHEMGDLAKSSAYYNPVADFCHRLAPEKPVLVAPADVQSMSQDELRASSVDIFAYQDAVGAGYVPGQYTYQPENRIATLDEVFARYRNVHEGTEKHLWADLEVWEMDGRTGYANPFPASFDRVKRQIDIERKYAPVLTAYAWHLYFHDPACQGDHIDPRARKLFEAYAAWKSQHDLDTRLR
ncbi:MAG: DUF4434 domain-containing protein [Pirellulaceae bacterium]|nr:DUF4434 domain-containing protein [Pirellulaceae bacterium]